MDGHRTETAREPEDARSGTSPSSPRPILPRERAAIFLLGFAAFLPLYAPQSVLPQLARSFQASPAETGAVIGATTLAVALSAPLAGPLTDRFGRKRSMLVAIAILVPLTLLLTLCGSLSELLAVRFSQGIVLPALFTGAVAYIGTRWEGTRGASVTGMFVTGSAIGGFAGRFVSGLVADIAGWQSGFAALAMVSALCAVFVALWLAPDRGRGTGSILGNIRAMREHLQDGRIRAVSLCGGTVLFSMTGCLSYLGFHLAEPPFELTAAGIGLVFLVYPLSATAPLVNSRLLSLLGTGNAYRVAFGVCAVGQLLLLLPDLTAVVAGIGIFLGGVFLCQSLALGYVGRVATANTGAAAGLYVCCFYLGGSLGAIAPGLLWKSAGWPGCVALVLAALATGALISLTMREQNSRVAEPV